MTDVVEQLNRLLAAERAGVEALPRLGDHAADPDTRTLFSQIRALRRLRRETSAKTQLIVASIREWQSLVRVAGWDVHGAVRGPERVPRSDRRADQTEGRGGREVSPRHGSFQRAVS